MRMPPVVKLCRTNFNFKKQHMAGSMPPRLLFPRASSSSERLLYKYPDPDKIESMFVYSSLTREADVRLFKNIIFSLDISPLCSVAPLIAFL